MIDRGMLDYVMERVRPQLQADGGDVAVTEIDDERGIVYVTLHGECVGCPMSAITLSQGIEKVLVEHVPGVKRVLPDMEATDFGDESVMGGLAEESRAARAEAAEKQDEN